MKIKDKIRIRSYHISNGKKSLAYDKTKLLTIYDAEHNPTMSVKDLLYVTDPMNPNRTKRPKHAYIVMPSDTSEAGQRFTVVRTKRGWEVNHTYFTVGAVNALAFFTSVAESVK